MAEISVLTEIKAPIELVWDCWTKPEHITQWNFAADTWHCPSAENDLTPNGKFCWRMEARDGTMGFDFKGTYTKIIHREHIAFKFDDNRVGDVEFLKHPDSITVVETFEPEDQNEIDLQRQGWQMILNNFGRYVESQRD